MVWHSHLFKNLPHFVVTHKTKGFHAVNEAGVDVFLELLCFFQDPTNFGNLISGSSASSKTQLVHLEVLGSCTAEGYLEGFWA